jgi:hypothetical protein
LIPEQFLITSVRDDVVDYGRRGKYTVALTFDAQRIFPKEHRPRASPSGIVSTSCGPFSRMQRSVLLAINVIR